MPPHCGRKKESLCEGKWDGDSIWRGRIDGSGTYKMKLITGYDMMAVANVR